MAKKTSQALTRRRSIAARSTVSPADDAASPMAVSGSRKGQRTTISKRPARLRQFPRRPKFRNDPDRKDLLHCRGLHEGKGVIDVKFFFRSDGAPRPALLLLYAIPPGASEGVHKHQPGDSKLGSFDEFYYILSGNGEMQIDGQRVPIKRGDHIFTPNGVAHGIENTSSKKDLTVYLVAMMRD
jgi:hypothetical protein